MTVAAWRDVVLCAPVTEPYVRRSERPALWFLARVLARLLAAAGLARDAVDGLCVASFGVAPDGPSAIAQHLGLAPRYLETLPTGGASGVMALRRAARAVQCGDAEIVACIAGDTNDAGALRELMAGFSTISRDCVFPYGAGGPNASFALITEHAMRRTGATREDFGRLCVAQRANASCNPGALLRRPITIDDYLAARPIAPPLHLLDCVMPCAGGDGFLVMSGARAASLGLPGVRVLGAIERHNAFAADDVQWRGGWAMDRDTLWAQAAIGPDEVDLIETYDDYPVISMMQFEDLGLCGKAEGPAFIRRHDFTLAGDRPHNTGGGQLSGGQAGAAGGFLGLVEAMRQLLRLAPGRQVARARHALVSGFGMINYDRGVSTAAAVLAA